MEIWPLPFALDAGGDETDVKRLSKEIKNEMKRAKSELQEDRSEYCKLPLFYTGSFTIYKELLSKYLILEC